MDFQPNVCECCEQTTEYALAVDRGTVDIVCAIANFIKQKGINIVHPRKEMESQGFMTSSQVCNLSRPRFHGLIASVKTERGNYCLTRKGIGFLKGTSIPKYAIIDKTTKTLLGYYEPEQYQVTITDILGEEYWEGINYNIEEGRVVTELGQARMI